jgi:hypothetical protein
VPEDSPYGLSQIGGSLRVEQALYQQIRNLYRRSGIHFPICALFFLKHSFIIPEAFWAAAGFKDIELGV